MYNFRVRAHEEAGTFWSECLDIPEAHSAGDSLEELLANVIDGITLALTIYVDQGRKIPQATQPENDQEHAIPLPVQAVAKIALWNEMCDRGMRVADLARKLGISHPVATRLVDFEHNSKIEQVESALAKLGKRLTVSVEAA
ncbi:type II toxin-antitoxin system HicB family antitoxin [Pseudomonas putida]|uniref:type II toxin-antitoxin system HicB family antitoxin n=1 Tax=Pseudomonas putida TaxID=303 RepID=UPI002363E02F|nr:type II toxin-antitoxin system HicB family antitoxin [Pseudomonas putida]MDD1966962.1 type II toxin-antitoxin system HicB family antitoxin [Pseudomonas putida]